MRQDLEPVVAADKLDAQATNEAHRGDHRRRQVRHGRVFAGPGRPAHAPERDAALTRRHDRARRAPLRAVPHAARWRGDTHCALSCRSAPGFPPPARVGSADRTGLATVGPSTEQDVARVVLGAHRWRVSWNTAYPVPENKALSGWAWRPVSYTHLT